MTTEMVQYQMMVTWIAKRSGASRVSERVNGESLLWLCVHHSSEVDGVSGEDCHPHAEESMLPSSCRCLERWIGFRRHLRSTTSPLVHRLLGFLNPNIQEMKLSSKPLVMSQLLRAGSACKNVSSMIDLGLSELCLWVGILCYRNGCG